MENLDVTGRPFHQVIFIKFYQNLFRQSDGAIKGPFMVFKTIKNLLSNTSSSLMKLAGGLRISFQNSARKGISFNTHDTVMLNFECRTTVNIGNVLN